MWRAGGATNPGSQGKLKLSISCFLDSFSAVCKLRFAPAFAELLSFYEPLRQ
jgi:hypothetical protein